MKILTIRSDKQNGGHVYDTTCGTWSQRSRQIILEAYLASIVVVMDQTIWASFLQTEVDVDGYTHPV